jgi:hypothetical protein
MPLRPSLRAPRSGRLKISLSAASLKFSKENEQSGNMNV